MLGVSDALTRDLESFRSWWEAHSFDDEEDGDAEIDEESSDDQGWSDWVRDGRELVDRLQAGTRLVLPAKLCGSGRTARRGSARATRPRCDGNQSDETSSRCSKHQRAGRFTGALVTSRCMARRTEPQPAETLSGTPGSVGAGLERLGFVGVGSYT